MFDFSGHKVRVNHKVSLPYHMIFYDSETKHTVVDGEQHHTIDFGWINYCRYKKDDGFIRSKFHLITNQKAFCDTLEKYTYEKSTLYIFAHNIFFDLQVSGFFKYMTRRGWIKDFYYDEGLTYILCIRKDKKRIKCISTTNYFDSNLKSLGKIIGREKTEVDFEKSTRDELIEYCYNDTMIIRESMEYYFKFIVKHDLGRFAMTKSSQSFNAYRHRFMKQGIFIHDEENVVDLERSAYHGGRVECYQLGKLDKSQYVCLDINSMYPYIMMSRKMPSMLISSGDSLSLSQASELLENYAIIAEVEIETDQPIYGIKSNGKLLFPIGRFTAYLCTQGLFTALKNNHVKKINRYAVYEKAFLFTDYVEYFYNLRQQYKHEGNKVYEQLCKYFMNTLYGKFGQQQTLIEEEYDVTFDSYLREYYFDLVTNERIIFTKMFNKVWTEGEKINAKNTLVAIPAHITEYGRIMLYDLIRKADNNSVIYCDTDSLIANKTVLRRLHEQLDVRQLGKLKLEYTTEHLTIHGCKDYETDFDVKIKGVPKSAVKISDNTYQYMQFLGQSSHLSRKVVDTFIIRPIVKENKRVYDKGVVQPDGRVLPIFFSDV